MTLKTLPLDAWHRAQGGRMVPFAGYEMPVQYAGGIKAEHEQVRERAGLFDVSHMGQAFLVGPETGSPDAHRAVAEALETLLPGEIQKLKHGRIRYTVLLSDEGGILDDLMVTRLPDPADDGRLFLVVNAAVKAEDFAFMSERLAGKAQLDVLEGRCLLALQGPGAAAVMAELVPASAELPFMGAMDAEIDGVPILLSRCGYTGEDGFELSIPSEQAEAIADRLVAFDAVEPVGLGARDTLRLEAGLCLYGHDMTPDQTPIGADLGFCIGKRRREAGDFPGADRMATEAGGDCQAIRVGMVLDGKAPAREGAEIQSPEGETIGRVTSGGFAPTLGQPVAMGYVPPGYAAPDTPLHIIVRGKALPARVRALPFVPHRYHSAKKSA